MMSHTEMMHQMVLESSAQHRHPPALPLSTRRVTRSLGQKLQSARACFWEMHSQRSIPPSTVFASLHLLHRCVAGGLVCAHAPAACLWVGIKTVQGQCSNNLEYIPDFIQAFNTCNPHWSCLPVLKASKLCAYERSVLSGLRFRVNPPITPYDACVALLRCTLPGGEVADASDRQDVCPAHAVQRECVQCLRALEEDPQQIMYSWPPFEVAAGVLHFCGYALAHHWPALVGMLEAARVGHVHAVLAQMCAAGTVQRPHRAVTSQATPPATPQATSSPRACFTSVCAVSPLATGSPALTVASPMAVVRHQAGVRLGSNEAPAAAPAPAPAAAAPAPAAAAPAPAAAAVPFLSATTTVTVVPCAPATVPQPSALPPHASSDMVVG